MPGLISQIDGINAILFHVEHLPGIPWEYRWRIIGDYPPPYLVWREQTTRQSHVRLQSEIRDCAIEVEWRSVEPTTLPLTWLPVAHYQLTTPRAVFTLLADHPFSPSEEFIVCAPVRDDGVAAYRFPAVSLEPGVECRAYAQADAPAWANVLLTPGEFRPRVTGITITNAAPSEDAWLEVPHEGPFRLSRCPHGAARRWFAVGHDLVPAGLLPATSPFPA